MLCMLRSLAKVDEVTKCLIFEQPQCITNTSELKVSGWPRVRRAAGSISGTSLLPHAIAYTWNSQAEVNERNREPSATDLCTD
jgi:hypothetical protein